MIEKKWSDNGMSNQQIQAKEKAHGKVLVYMNASDKERFDRIAKAHGLSLSAFFRLTANEYINAHNWDDERR